MRGRILLVGTLVALLALVAPSSVFAGHWRSTVCTGGTIAAGTYHRLIVTGVCTVAPGADVKVRGDVIVKKGASLNDHGAEGFLGGQMQIRGNVWVSRGAILGIGYNAPETTQGPDKVGGNIVADHPRTLYIGNATIRGSVISFGGGVASTSAADFRNFPIKDNVIRGSLLVIGWHGGWLGVIRNHVRGNVIVAKNVSSSSDAGPGTDSDSTEIMGSVQGTTSFPQKIGGNLICFGNIPAAQVNPADGGAPNQVAGHKLGECKGL